MLSQIIIVIVILPNTCNLQLLEQHAGVSMWLPHDFVHDNFLIFFFSNKYSTNLHTFFHVQLPYHQYTMQQRLYFYSYFCSHHSSTPAEQDYLLILKHAVYFLPSIPFSMPFAEADKHYATSSLLIFCPNPNQQCLTYRK